MMRGRQAGRIGVALLAAGVLASGCSEPPDRQAYRQGLRAFQRGRFEQSAALLRDSLDRGGDPESRAGRFNCLGLALRRAGRAEEARSAFEQSAALDGGYAAPVYNLGVLLAESGRVAEALDCFETAAARDPSDGRALQYRCWLLAGQQRWAEARLALDEARRREPRDPWNLTAQALFDLQATNVAGAISRLQEALEHHVRYAPALYNLARINHQWLRNDSQAESLFEEFLRLEPEGAPAESASRALAAIRATGAAARTKPDDASPDPGAGGTTSAEPPGPKAFVPVLVDDRLRVAELLAARGRGEAAVNNYLLAAREADRTRRPTLRDRALRAAEELCGENPRAHYELGLYWIEAAQPEKALGRFKQAAALSNTWYEAHIALARLAASGGEYDAAVVAARQADRAQPDRPEALWILAQLYDRRLELSEQAAACYREFVKRFDGDARSDEARARLQALGVDAPPAPAAGKPSRGLWPSLFRGRDRNNGAD